MAKFSERQIYTIIIGSCVNFFTSVCFSLQAPFYPAEAEKKGATATEYGFVMGCFELMNFIVSPFFGKMLKKVRPKVMLGFGMTTSSTALIIFGFLDLIESRVKFIFFSIVLRVLESIGSSAAVCASYSVISNAFPDNVATAMSTLETFYGLGFIVGPTIGGVLFEVGGFSLPFTVIGIITFIVIILMLVFIPDVTDLLSEKENAGGGRLWKALKVPSIALNVLAVFSVAISEGFYNSTLEPHLRTVFHISPIVVSVFFAIYGITFTVATPIFGRLIDKGVNTAYMIIFASVLSFISYSIIGPSPFLPIPSTIQLCAVAVSIQGFSTACGLVSTFLGLNESAAEAGFPDDISTYGLMSGIWLSSFSLGMFIGPSAGGCLSDLVGFQYATLFVIAVHTILLFILVFRLIVKKRKTEARKLYFTITYPEGEGETALDSSCNENTMLLNSLNSS